jgi:hypothetical protein
VSWGEAVGTRSGGGAPLERSGVGVRGARRPRRHAARVRRLARADLYAPTGSTGTEARPRSRASGERIRPSRHDGKRLEWVRDVTTPLLRTESVENSTGRLWTFRVMRAYQRRLPGAPNWLDFNVGSPLRSMRGIGGADHGRRSLTRARAGAMAILGTRRDGRLYFDEVELGRDGVGSSSRRNRSRRSKSFSERRGSPSRSTRKTTWRGVRRIGLRETYCSLP